MTRRGLTLIETLLAIALSAVVVAAGASVLQSVPTPQLHTAVVRDPVLEDAVDTFLESEQGHTWVADDFESGLVELLSSSEPSRSSEGVSFTTQRMDDGSRWTTFEVEGAVCLRWLPPPRRAEP